MPGIGQAERDLFKALERILVKLRVDNRILFTNGSRNHKEYRILFTKWAWIGLIEARLGSKSRILGSTQGIAGYTRR